MTEEITEERTPVDHHDWIGTITTNSGVAFDILNPTVDMVNIEDIAAGLSKACRYNGQIPTFYSVAEHSVRVSDWLIQENCHDLAFAGLMHDAAEAYLGDLVRPLKLLPQFGGLYKELEETVERVIGERFGIELFPMHPLVKDGDKAIYNWEVNNIRTAETHGWVWRDAERNFLERYNRYCDRTDMTEGASRLMAPGFKSPVVRFEEKFQKAREFAEVFGTPVPDDIEEAVHADLKSEPVTSSVWHNPILWDDFMRHVSDDVDSKEFLNGRLSYETEDLPLGGTLIIDEEVQAMRDEEKSEDPRNDWYKGYTDGITRAQEDQKEYEEMMFEIPVLLESTFERHWEYENGELVSVTYTETNRFKED